MERHKWRLEIRDTFLTVTVITEAENEEGLQWNFCHWGRNTRILYLLCSAI